MPIPATYDVFVDRSDLNYNYTLNENIYNFSEGINQIEQEIQSNNNNNVDHESIAITLTKIAKLLDDYTNTKKFLRTWEYWFYRWSNCRWYIQRQEHWLTKQKKAKQKLLYTIEENFKNIDGFLKKNNNSLDFDCNDTYNSSFSSSLSSKYLYRMKSTRKIWLHQQQQMRRGKKKEFYNKRLEKNNIISGSNKKINKLVTKSSCTSSIKKEKIKTNQNSLSLKYNQEFKYYHHYLPETLKHTIALNLAVKYINIWLKLQEKIVISNEDKKEEKIMNNMNNIYTNSHNNTLNVNNKTSKKNIYRNQNSLKCSAYTLLTTLMNRLQLYNSNEKSNLVKEDYKYKEVRKKKLSELQLFDIEIENKLGYDVKRYLKGICIIELLLIKVNCFDDKLFIHIINFFKQFIDLSFLIPFMKAYIINSKNISSWCVGMSWEFFHSINEIKLFWSIIHKKKFNKS
ncbi:hypothetical protein BCR32DRAFT_266712 [Anaeromyces robustus]|uniref:Uncharacterized protein n=1 Tax=Anaeromyces robustus TaxID=1754192 RepID=A0A1Y1XDK6_9FUNG|nr:hypothetical protein BCR32DRAFT_266712 [Anaeromyces robustus]|eukprot:ORX83838.1 hypothetical protein BCR32DRAFT_266712 [Anaeromyces robustus]